MTTHMISKHETEVLEANSIVDIQVFTIQTLNNLTSALCARNKSCTREIIPNRESGKKSI